MTHSDLASVSPTKPVAPYVGGKLKLAKTIIQRINEIEHDGYAEPFVGMGGIFLRRDQQPKTEAINDYSGDVANLFRILQRHYPQFMDCLKFQLTSRREFERLVKIDPTTLTDLERAARFLYLQRTTFGGKVSGRAFGVENERQARFNLTNLATMLEEVHERLSGVVIENLTWQDFMKRYDRKGMLFYLDPPYFGNENDFGKGLFSRDQFAEMAEILGSLKGQFILSLNDKPEVRETFKAFKIEPVTLTYSAGKSNSTQAKEVIISP